MFVVPASPWEVNGTLARCKMLSSNILALGRIDKTFWATAFGMVTDRFGVPWMVSCNSEA
jgi:uncharacterized glyoxalase superfamily protein PhnB